MEPKKNKLPKLKVTKKKISGNCGVELPMQGDNIIIFGYSDFSFSFQTTNFNHYDQFSYTPISIHHDPFMFTTEYPVEGLVEIFGSPAQIPKKNITIHRYDSDGYPTERFLLLGSFISRYSYRGGFDTTTEVEINFDHFTRTLV